LQNCRINVERVTEEYNLITFCLLNLFSTYKAMKKLIVLTGAGMSAESGIKTFRDSGGLWEE